MGDQPLPPQATLGLLNYITATSLDEDYALASAARSEPPAGPSPRAGQDLRRHLPKLLVLAAFGLLVATAGVQTARSEPARQSSRDSLIAQVQERREGLTNVRQEVARLGTSVDKARADLLLTSTTGRGLASQLSELGATTGTAAVKGPGVRIVVDDRPEARSGRETVLDTDLQILVNGLWESGAEAIAINGERLTNLTAIREAGDAITVNLRSLHHPYVVEAIGDPDQLPARFIDSDGGTWWLNLKAVYDLQFAMTREDSLTLPASEDVVLRHVRAPEADR
jgi:uncharacterized protein YlxW (UPF0749 family)